MSLVDTVTGWASEAGAAAGRFADSIGSWFSALPNTASPILTAIKAGNAAIDAGAKAGQGVPLAVAVADSAYEYAQGGDMGRVMADTGTAIADTAASITDTVNGFVETITAGPPLWVKLTIAGAVIIGVIYLAKGTVNHAFASA